MELFRHLFRLSGNPDAQLLLALVVGLTVQQQHGGDGGMRSRDLWEFVDARRRRSAIHPSIDSSWGSMREVTRALSRLRKRGLVVARPADALRGNNTNLWKPSSSGYAFLGDRILFTPTDSRRSARRRAA